MKEKEIEHVVIRSKKGKLEMTCNNCKTTEMMPMPESQQAVQSFANYFKKKHSGCVLGKLKK